MSSPPASGGLIGERASGDALGAEGARDDYRKTIADFDNNPHTRSDRYTLLSGEDPWKDLNNKGGVVARQYISDWVTVPWQDAVTLEKGRTAVPNGRVGWEGREMESIEPLLDEKNISVTERRLMY